MAKDDASFLRKRIGETGDANGGDTRADAKGGTVRKAPFDPAKDRLRVPKGREKEFEAYMDRLATLFNPVVWDVKNNRPVLKEDGKTLLGKDPSRPASNLVPPNWRDRQGKGEFDGDYDYVAAFLAGAEPGINPGDNAWHMGDVGKMPNHESFSVESYYARDPRWAPYAGRWEGETYIPPKSSDVRQDAKGGDAPGPETAVSETPVSEGGAPAPEGGPRIVINPTTFRNKKDALCVAFNEAFRVVMEDMQFDPVAEPTDRQREFFSDTAYAGDENQLRRTILARICTFDTSVKDPTDEQIQEAVEFLEYVMESGAPQNEWEQSAVQRIHDVLASVPAGQGEPEGEPAAEEAPEPPADEGAVEADVGGGDADDLPEMNEFDEFGWEITGGRRREEVDPALAALAGQNQGDAAGAGGLELVPGAAPEPEPVQPLNVQTEPGRSPAEGVRAHNADYRPGVGVQDGPARSPAEGVRAHNADYRPGVGVQDGPARSPAEGRRFHSG